jgi:glyoxylase-like metal-dependent hydrolase (beta-lactamase superfamily II)
MPLVDRYPLGEYQSNCYLVRSASDADAVVVDPGGEPSPVLDALEQLGARVAAILVTHTDVDHIAGVAELAERTGAEVWGPAGEIDALRDGRSRTGTPVRPHDAEHAVRGGDTMAAAGTAFEVVDVPGHSAGHVAFAADGAVFSGDLLFAGSVGRVDLPGGDWPTLLESVQRLLERVGPDAVVYPGHGEPTTIGRELETNPFLAELRAARPG